MIEADDIKIKLHSKKADIDEIYSSLDIEKKTRRIDEINHLMESQDFWNDVDKANLISK